MSAMTKTSQRRKSADRHALRARFTIEGIFNLSKIDRWFLLQMNAGLIDATALRLERGYGKAQPQHTQFHQASEIIPRLLLIHLL